MRSWIRLGWVCALSGVLALGSGCAGSRYGLEGSGRDEDSNWRDLRLSGTNPVTRGSLEIINLVELMDPDGKAESLWKRQPSNQGQSWDALAWATKYDITMARFAEIHKLEALTNRNLVQNRLMVAAERRCGRYIQFLRSDSSSTNFAFASATGVLATLGALIKSPDTAKTFSALGGMASGLRAEYNNEFYSNLAISVITRGIAERRRMLREELEHKQTSVGYDRYDIAAAIRDAVEFDSACNIINGLETANEAVQRLNEPGRDAMNRALLKQSLTTALVKGDEKSITDYNKALTALNLNPATTTARFLALPDTRTAAPARSVPSSSDALAPVKQARYQFEDLKSMLSQATKDLKEQATQARPATVSDVSLTAAVGTLTTATLKLENHISETFGATGTVTASCFAKAQTLSAAINKLQSSLERTANATMTVTERDQLAQKQSELRQFFEAMTRSGEATADRIAAALAKLEKPKTSADDFIKAVNAAAAELESGAWTKQLGQRTCANLSEPMPTAP
jgi:hypothetical protein